MEEYSTLVQCLIALICQVVFVGFRTINIQHAINGSILENIGSNIGIQLTWILGTTFGVKAVLEGDMIIFTAYVLGGVLGIILVLMRKGRPWSNKHKTKVIKLNVPHWNTNIRQT